jgi:hypothetical protein
MLPRARKYEHWNFSSKRHHAEDGPGSAANRCAKAFRVATLFFGNSARTVTPPDGSLRQLMRHEPQP